METTTTTFTFCLSLSDVPCLKIAVLCILSSYLVISGGSVNLVSSLFIGQKAKVSIHKLEMTRAP